MDETEMQGLSKHKRRQLKKQMRAEQAMADSSRKEGRERLKKTAGYGIAAVVLVVIGVTMFSFLGRAPPGENAKMVLSDNSHDFGNVSVMSGSVSASFSISNSGEDDLVIDRIVSSCMCTTAKLYFNGVESPEFGMHSDSSFWSQAIPLGQSAELRVFYDPTVHPDLRGPVTRAVTIYSNDPGSPNEIRIEANQVS